jgi:hypothetical protein
LNIFPVTADAVALSLAMDLNIYVDPNALTHRRSAEEVEQGLATADFVMLTTRLLTWLPGSMFAPQIWAKLAADSRWHLIASASDYAVFARTQCR